MTKSTWHWPDQETLRAYVLYGAAVSILFFAGYGGSNWLTQWTMPLRLYLPAELSIPLVPAMILPYFSINLLFVLPPFRLEAVQMRLLGRQMIAATVVATACFLYAPTVLGFPPPNVATSFAPLYDLLDRVQYPYNCLPSLHVAYSSLIVVALAERGSGRLRAALALWLVLIIASTVFAHQHHLIDIVGGVVLSVVARLAANTWPRATIQVARADS
jgi:membrane-associated phospholipid phosphatase